MLYTCLFASDHSLLPLEVSRTAGHSLSLSTVHKCVCVVKKSQEILSHSWLPHQSATESSGGLAKSADPAQSGKEGSLNLLSIGSDETPRGVLGTGGPSQAPWLEGQLFSTTRSLTLAELSLLAMTPLEPHRPWTCPTMAPDMQRG